MQLPFPDLPRAEHDNCINIILLLCSDLPRVEHDQPASLSRADCLRPGCDRPQLHRNPQVTTGERFTNRKMTEVDPQIGEPRPRERPGEWNQ